jgi:hypothetical protein
MLHFEMKSGRLSAARASSSIDGSDVLHATICGTITRPTPPPSYSFWQNVTTRQANAKARSRMSWPFS